MKTERFYRQRKERKDGVWSYYITVSTADGSEIEVEVSRGVYKELLDLQREHWRLERREARHTYHLDQLGELWQSAAQNLEELPDTTSSEHSPEDIKRAIDVLPPEQRRRFLLYHLYTLNSVQIAAIEGCSDRAVRYSIAAARKNLQKSLGV